MKKVKSTKLGLRALNNIVIVEEDKMTEYQGSIVIPDAYEYFAKKYPCTGHILAVGDKVRSDIKVGDHIIFARHGVQRYDYEGRQLCDIRESDIHAVLT